MDLESYAQYLEELEDSAVAKLADCNLNINRVYAGEAKTFIYDYLNYDTAIGIPQKMIIAYADYISVYDIAGMKRTKIVMVVMSETSNEAYIKLQLAIKSMARFRPICCALDVERFRYLLYGVAHISDNMTWGIIKSDWLTCLGNSFSTGRPWNIDFMDCSWNEKEFYKDVLYLIARPYIRNPESRMYLAMGCDNYWNYIDDIWGDDLLDRDGQYKKNMIFYVDLYGTDFYDDLSIDIQEDEIKQIDVFVDDDEEEVAWSMLELQLAEENRSSQDINEYAVNHKNEGINEENTDYRVLKEMTPLQMLEYIKGR